MPTSNPNKQDLAQFQKDAVDVAAAMAKAMFEINKDKRVCMVGAIRVAAGTAAMGGLDLHRAIQMFMSFYKDADQKFEGKK
jgi:hypothetical protein